MAVLVFISVSQYPSSDIQLPKYLNCFLSSTSLLLVNNFTFLLILWDLLITLVSFTFIFRPYFYVTCSNYPWSAAANLCDCGTPPLCRQHILPYVLTHQPPWCQFLNVYWASSLILYGRGDIEHPYLNSSSSRTFSRHFCVYSDVCRLFYIQSTRVFSNILMSLFQLTLSKAFL